MNKKKIALISAGGFIILLLIFVPKLIGPSHESIAFLAFENITRWASLQVDYQSKHNKVGSLDDIGFGGYSDPYKLNNRCKEKDCFKFYGKFTPGIPAVGFGIKGSPGTSRFCAENNEDLGKCKAGNKWCVSMDDAGKLKVSEPEDKSCKKLTPNFSKLR